MGRRDEWQKVLDRELARWSALTAEDLVMQLASGREYEVKRNSKTYQVEAQILEDTPRYVHVMVSVDDGVLPDSLSPVSESFIRERGYSAGASYL
jgi:hypothetical protein